jgi:hypothetical protein
MVDSKTAQPHVIGLDGTRTTSKIQQICGSRLELSDALSDSVTPLELGCLEPAKLHSPFLSLSRRAISRSFISQSIQAILLQKLGCCICFYQKMLRSLRKALELRHDKSFRRVTEEGSFIDSSRSSSVELTKRLRYRTAGS